MKEIADIVHAYKIARQAGRRTALATVVHVVGSSYRRPGARMLVTEDGHLTGAISGGCLEGDALRKALLAINEQKNKLVTYDTTDEDDAKFGIQLGCNGIVHILFEPVPETDKNNPIILLQKIADKRKDAVLVTLFSLRDARAAQPGTGLLYRNNEHTVNFYAPGSLQFMLEREAVNTLENKLSSCKEYTWGNTEFTAFFSFVRPIVQLIVAGAGNDALPLAAIASLLGWHTVIADGRANQATPQRFPTAKKVLVTKPAELPGQVEIDQQTAFVLMTHNYNYDLELLRLLTKLNVPYIGVLGPKKKLERMFDELQQQGISINNKLREKIHGPVGLDIGAETAEEIALSIAAEIKAALSARAGKMLKQEDGPIHQRGQQGIDTKNVVSIFETHLKVS